MPLAAYNDTVWSASLFDSLGFYSSMDDIFTRLLTLASYISRRFIQFIEDLAVRDADRYSDDLLVISAGQHLRSLRHGICKSFSEGCSSPSKSCNPETSERRASEPTEIQDLKFLASRVQKTLQGSSDDIGWLPRTPGLLGVEDGTARFLELLAGIRYQANIIAPLHWMVGPVKELCSICYHICLVYSCIFLLLVCHAIYFRNGEHTLPSSFVYLLIPGLYSNHGPLYFVGTKKFFTKMGLACHIAKIHSEASVEHNAWEIKQYIEELYWGSSKRVMLLGHSKGGVDAAAALSIYWCDLKDKVAGLALGDIRALEDLTHEKQKEFIMKHKLPYEQIPLVTFHSDASIAPYKEYNHAATL
ncbi:unnamed protein product [Prunus armeniaca]|uniref:Uncharacterized protein n=1 Tax=Prunus armeniaca TaxID=36596 RepID=A0A6J5Y190_PRUAR|nr:unnamed protein product [Prunus armeniaca]